MDTKYLIIGLGSMGKRRIRNLMSLGIKNIAGFDPRADRRDEAKNKYGISVFEEFEIAVAEFKPKAYVISTPPDMHMHYAYHAIDRKINCFIEASVVDLEKIYQLVEKIKHLPIVMAPSCTMRFFPGPRKIRELIDDEVIGKILTINYHTGQYLPDWHPWERVQDFYVAQRETGGAREIVPFELNWLNDIFGTPIPLACFKEKLSDIPVDIDDYYHCVLKYNENILLNLTVEVLSRPTSTRYMRIVGSDGLIIFDGEANSVKYKNKYMTEWDESKFDSGNIQYMYINPEEPYIAEMKCFIDAVQVQSQALFPHSLEKDSLLLETLIGLEKLSGNSK